MLADAATPDLERAAARAVLASLAPEPWAVGVGALGVLLAAAVGLWTVLRGGA